MRVHGLEFDIAWEDPATNFQRAEGLVGDAARGGAHFVVLPEMFATGFSMNAEEVVGYAQEIRAFLSGLARETGIHLLGGYAEPGDPKPRNASSIYDPAGGEVLHYAKIHPFTLAREQEHYSGGDAVATVEIEGVRVTPFICYDLRFPEPFRAAADRTDLFVVIANWPEKRREAWSALLKARAIENQAFVLGVNRIGHGGGEPHSGDSALLDPFGQDCGLAAEVSGEAVAEARERFSFLADRRPDVYRELWADRDQAHAETQRRGEE